MNDYLFVYNLQSKILEINCFWAWVFIIVLILSNSFLYWIFRRELRYYVKLTEELRNRLYKVTDQETMERREKEFLKMGSINVKHHD